MQNHGGERGPGTAENHRGVCGSKQDLQSGGLWGAAHSPGVQEESRICLHAPILFINE